MAITPSEERKLRREIAELFARNDELDKKQSDQIEALGIRVEDLEKKVEALEKKPAKAKKPVKTKG